VIHSACSYPKDLARLSLLELEGVMRQDTSINWKYVAVLRLTNSMEPSRPWEANSRSATHECPNILWNPKILCRVNKSPQMVLILRERTPVYTTPSYFSKINFSIILPLRLVVSFLLILPPKPCMHSSSLPCVLHAILISSFWT
jgi:hypothetical protein